MQPAFSSTRQVLAFCALLAVIILLPAVLLAVVTKTGWLQIRDRYPALGGAVRGGFNASYLEHQVFTATNPVDIAFIGSSGMLYDINTPFVQQQLSQHLHREAEVVTLGWVWSGCDLVYFVARDLLEHRPVRLLVVGNEEQLEFKPGATKQTIRQQSVPHRAAYAWFWRGEEVSALGLLQLPLTEIVNLYGAAILDLPRHLLDLARANRADQDLPAQIALRGAHRSQSSSAPGPADLAATFSQRAKATPADVVVYADGTRAKFDFIAPPWDRYQLYFARRLAQLCREHGTELVALHLPWAAEAQQETIPVSTRWTEELGMPVQLIGVPGARFFSGFSPGEVPQAFYGGDDRHLNTHGQDLLTQLVTPTLLKRYDATSGSF